MYVHGMCTSTKPRYFITEEKYMSDDDQGMKNDIIKRVGYALSTRKGGKTALNRFYCILLRFASSPQKLMVQKNLHMKTLWHI